MNGIVYRGYGGLFSSRQPFARWLWDGTKVQHHYGGSPTAQGGVNDGSPLCLPAIASLLAQARPPAEQARRTGEAGGPVPGALNIGDGGGKEEGRLLGCGLEKRPPYPRLTELAGVLRPVRREALLSDLAV